MNPLKRPSNGEIFRCVTTRGVQSQLLLPVGHHSCQHLPDYTRKVAFSLIAFRACASQKPASYRLRRWLTTVLPAPHRRHRARPRTSQLTGYCTCVKVCMSASTVPRVSTWTGQARFPVYFAPPCRPDARRNRPRLRGAPALPTWTTHNRFPASAQRTMSPGRRFFPPQTLLIQRGSRREEERT